MADQRGRLRIGTSGYQYRHWQGLFYPRDLPRRQWFDYYTRHFDTVEINNTFYRLPDGPIFGQWHNQAPGGFLYALKFSRYGSHLKHLKDPGQSIGRFLTAARLLGRHLGPILVQLPPRWRADPQRLDEFLARAPKGQRWAVEFRDADWLRDEVFDILSRHGAALCIHDLISRHPRVLTTDWTYLRFHGEHDAGSYTAQFLGAQGKRIREMLAAGHDVYAYFNNDREAHAVHNALDLKRYVAG